MQTKTKNSIVDSISLYVADKPFLLNQFEKFVPEREMDNDLDVYSAFSGSIHEMPSRMRRVRR